MKRTLLIALSALLCLYAGAKRQKSGPTKLVRSEVVAPAPEELFDTVRPGAVRCSGYEKPNQSVRETFFVTNLDSIDIAGIGLEFEYFDIEGRQLHRAIHSLKIDVPAGETRAVSVSSWDRNNAFHYYRSAAPKRRRSSPYKVKSKVLYVLRRR